MADRIKYTWDHDIMAPRTNIGLYIYVCHGMSATELHVYCIAIK